MCRTTPYFHSCAIERKGFVLPVVLGLLVLVMSAAFLISSVGSGTRRMSARAEGANLCRLAVESAISEAAIQFRQFIEPHLVVRSSAPSFLRGLAPPFPQNEEAELSVDVPLTIETFARYGVEITDGKVTILRLDAGSYGNNRLMKNQGLLRFIVTATWIGPRGAKVPLHACEDVRFTLSHDGKGYQLKLCGGPACRSSRGGKA